MINEIKRLLIMTHKIIINNFTVKLMVQYISFIFAGYYRQSH